MRLCDTRYASIATGVGTSKILGKVHAASLEIDGNFFTCSFTILENVKMDFLFGLDNLKRHKCCIDLIENSLHMDNGAITIKFLNEREIKDAKAEEEKM